MITLKLETIYVTFKYNYRKKYDLPTRITNGVKYQRRRLEMDHPFLWPRWQS